MGHQPAQPAYCVVVPMPSALSSPPWLSSRSWPEKIRCYCQIPSKICGKHTHYTRIPPRESGFHLTIDFFENGRCFCLEVTSTQKHKNDKNGNCSHLRLPNGGFFPLGWFIWTSSSESWLTVTPESHSFPSINVRLFSPVKPDLLPVCSCFPKVVLVFLIVKIFTVFELVAFHTYFTQSVELIHQNQSPWSRLSESVAQ